MGIRKAEGVILAIILFSFLVGFYFYPQMPARMAFHWNACGEVDGYTSRFLGSFSLPFILVGVGLLSIAIPRIDPLKANIEEFRKYYDRFMVLLLLFLSSIHLQVILWNAGVRLGPNVTFPIGLGVIFFYAGILCENARRNWFVGIRTPWTLSDERVWDKTHKVGGKLFKAAGIAAFLGVFVQRYAVLFVLVPVILIAAYTTVYSYLEYRKAGR
jgi:uncharacterized membrane protein